MLLVDQHLEPAAFRGLGGLHGLLGWDASLLGVACTMRAIWNGSVIAESDDTVVVEGNHYFPIDSVDAAVLRASDATSHCPWKGDASYYSLEVDGQTNAAAAWYYPDPKAKAAQIADRVAFWKGVDVTE